MKRSIVFSAALAFALLPSDAFAELRRVQLAVLGMD